MDILEHPFEAVAFRLYSLPESSAATGAAAWTCLAAVLAAAAAAGLWRLRASSAPTAVTATAKKHLELGPAPTDEALAARAPSRASEPAAASVAPSPKERYTAYYRDPCRVGCCDDDGGNDDDREDDAEERDGDGGSGAYRTSSELTDNFGFGGWEEVVRSLALSPTAAKVEMGLGRYRSPTALGGSVVQLWDQVAVGGSTPTASPRRTNRVVATVPGF